MMILGSWLLDSARKPWAILGGNLVAALVMLGILFRDHRGFGVARLSAASSPSSARSGTVESKCWYRPAS